MIWGDPEGVEGDMDMIIILIIQKQDIFQIYLPSDVQNVPNLHISLGKINKTKQKAKENKKTAQMFLDSLWGTLDYRSLL